MVAIKNMKEISKSCSECTFKASDYVCGLLDCAFSCNHFKERNYNCPLVEIEERKVEKLERIERIVNAPMGGKHMKYNKIVEVLEQD